MPGQQPLQYKEKNITKKGLTHRTIGLHNKVPIAFAMHPHSKKPAYNWGGLCLPLSSIITTSNPSI